MVEPPRQPEPATQPPAKPARPRSSRTARAITWLARGYLLAVTLAWAWMVIEGDREAWATLFLFGPRWIGALPLVPLLVAAAFWHRRSLLLLSLAAIGLVGPIMGFQVHLPHAQRGRPLVRFMTFNVDQHAVSVEALARLIADYQPDVVALQEVRADAGYKWPAGWQVIERNEFILASRWPIAEREHVLRFRGDYAAIRYTLDLDGREIDVFNVHLSTPRPGLEAMLDRHTLFDRHGAAQLREIVRLRAVESEHTSAWVAGFAAPKIVAGDFNMPAESVIFRRDWSQLSDAFATAGWGFGFTKLERDTAVPFGVRIDHILVNRPWRVLRSWVGPDVGSDHLPLWAELDFDQP